MIFIIVNKLLFGIMFSGLLLIPLGSAQQVFGGSAECQVSADCDDSNECTFDNCVFNDCVNTPLSGTACGSGSDTECDNPDVCFLGGCQDNPVQQGTSCDADGDVCTTDTCDGSGICEVGPHVPPTQTSAHSPGDETCFPLVGGKTLSLDSTSLLVSGASSSTWMIPLVLSGIGIGLFVVSRKSENS